MLILAMAMTIMVGTSATAWASVNWNCDLNNKTVTIYGTGSIGDNQFNILSKR